MSKSRTQLGRRVDRQTPKTETTATVTENEVPAGERQKVSPPSEIADNPPADSRQTKAGRPPGAKNREYVRGERNPGMCPKCKCTESKVESTRVIPLPNDPDYKFVALIRCMCANSKCGQWRVDRQKCNPAE